MSFRKKCYKDINKWRNTKDNYNRRYYGKTAIYGRQKWTQDELELVLRHDIPDRELSEQIHHSMHAIQTMRSRLKHIK